MVELGFDDFDDVLATKFRHDVFGNEISSRRLDDVFGNKISSPKRHPEGDVQMTLLMTKFRYQKRHPDAGDEISLQKTT